MAPVLIGFLDLIDPLGRELTADDLFDRILEELLELYPSDIELTRNLKAGLDPGGAVADEGEPEDSSSRFSLLSGVVIDTSEEKAYWSS